MLALGVAPGVALGTLIGAWLAHDLLDEVEENYDRLPLVLFAIVYLLLIVANVLATV